MLDGELPTAPVLVGEGVHKAHPPPVLEQSCALACLAPVGQQTAR